MRASLSSHEQLELFCRQVRQRLPVKYLEWPDFETLRDNTAQGKIFETLLLPARERSKEIKDLESVSEWDKNWRAHLASSVEAAAYDGGSDIDDALMDECARFQRLPAMSAQEAAQSSVKVIYCATHNDPASSVSISLWEKPQVLSDAGSTGHRTWEGALALATAIFNCWLPHGRLQEKRILELGAGTGLLSFLCAAEPKHGASRVVATDGDQGVIGRLLVNHEDNVLNLPTCSKMKFGVYQWGQQFEDTFIGEELRDGNFDLVIGADVTYDPSAIPDLVKTLRLLFDRNSSTECIISAAERNGNTLQGFLTECKKSKLRCTTRHGVSRPIDEQREFFHLDWDAIRFVEIVAE